MFILLRVEPLLHCTTNGHSTGQQQESDCATTQYQAKRAVYIFGVDGHYLPYSIGGYFYTSEDCMFLRRVERGRTDTSSIHILGVFPAPNDGVYSLSLRRNLFTNCPALTSGNSCNNYMHLEWPVSHWVCVSLSLYLWSSLIEHSIHFLIEFWSYQSFIPKITISDFHDG